MKQRCAFTITELLALLAIITMLLALTIPALARTRAGSGVAGSMANIMTLGVAHVVYAADWNGRQVTWTVDDLGAYDSVLDYNVTNGCTSALDPDCHPGIVWGWGQNGSLYGYWMNNAGYHWAVMPINFDGGASHFGQFRFPNTRPFHEYVNGRVYDPVFYAPLDTLPLEIVEPAFDEPAELDISTELNPPIWISYVMSPAAMYDPGVMRANADGGWQDPWSFDQGFQSPGLFQASYPALKTFMLEHHWLQNPPPDICNPGFSRFGSVLPCEPWYFNHSIDSEPVTLFYDLSVRLLPNTEVLAGDQQVLKQTGEIDGLWHRGTPFGESGYFIDVSFDGVPLSHHILTTDGILGRDTLGDQGAAAAWDGAGFKPAAAAAKEASFSVNTGPRPALTLEPQP